MSQLLCLEVQLFEYPVVAILGVSFPYDIIRSECRKCEPAYCRLAGRCRSLSHSSGDGLERRQYFGFLLQEGNR
jgi:hypothetical protein